MTRKLKSPLDLPVASSGTPPSAASSLPFALPIHFDSSFFEDLSLKFDVTKRERERERETYRERIYAEREKGVRTEECRCGGGWNGEGRGGGSEKFDVSDAGFRYIYGIDTKRAVRR